MSESEFDFIASDEDIKRLKIEAKIKNEARLLSARKKEIDQLKNILNSESPFCPHCYSIVDKGFLQIMLEEKTACLKSTQKEVDILKEELKNEE